MWNQRPRLGQVPIVWAQERRFLPSVPPRMAEAETAQPVCSCEFFNNLGQGCAMPTEGAPLGEPGLVGNGEASPLGTIAVVGGLGVVALLAAGVI